jgi:hypothetical protein
MFIESQLVIEQLFNKAHLTMFKIHADVTEDIDIDTGKQIYLVSATGLSERGHKTSVSFIELPFTEQGLEQAERLVERLNNWRY